MALRCGGTQLALHLWIFDMASSLRTQLMFGEPVDPASRACVGHTQPLTQRLLVGTVCTMAQQPVTQQVTQLLH